MGRWVGGKVCVWVDGQVGRWRRRTLDEALRDLSYTYYGYTYYGYTYYGSTHYGAPLMRPCATFAYRPLGSKWG